MLYHPGIGIQQTTLICPEMFYYLLQSVTNASFFFSFLDADSCKKTQKSFNRCSPLGSCNFYYFIFLFLLVLRFQAFEISIQLKSTIQRKAKQKTPSYLSLITSQHIQPTDTITATAKAFVNFLYTSSFTIILLACHTHQRGKASIQTEMNDKNRH